MTGEIIEFPDAKVQRGLSEDAKEAARVLVAASLLLNTYVMHPNAAPEVIAVLDDAMLDVDAYLKAILFNDPAALDPSA